MAKAKAKRDVFVNRAIERCTQSAANTLTFQQINFAVGVFQGVALLIHQIKYHLGAGAWTALAGIADSFQVAITNSSQIADILMTRVEVIDVKEYTGTGNLILNDFWQADQTLITDFSTLPGGGILVPANPIFIGLDSAGYPAALIVDMEILFTFVELADSDYIELIQSTRQANI